MAAQPLSRPGRADAPRYAGAVATAVLRSDFPYFPVPNEKIRCSRRQNSLFRAN
jgi:hypothetical protein